MQPASQNHLLNGGKLRREKVLKVQESLNVQETKSGFATIRVRRELMDSLKMESLRMNVFGRRTSEREEVSTAG